MRALREGEPDLGFAQEGNGAGAGAEGSQKGDGEIVKIHIEIEDIPWGDIEPNPQNPNELEETGMAALKAEISERGFVQPCLVRPHPEKDARYELIDGEHRWRILGELGVETVPCVVDRDASDIDAQIRTISMNRLRGQFVPIRLAHLLADLKDRIPESELRDRLAMNQGDLANLLALEGYLEEGESESVPRPKGEVDSQVEVAIVATGEQAERIDVLLKQLTSEDPEKESAVLSRRAREWMA